MFICPITYIKCIKNMSMIDLKIKEKTWLQLEKQPGIIIMDRKRIKNNHIFKWKQICIVQYYKTKCMHVCALAYNHTFVFSKYG